MSPQPSMFLEYMPLRNLEDAHETHELSRDECLVILHQSLSALDYLHTLPTPVAHRDLKPENILVQHRDPNGSPGSLLIKLSDFGPSRAGKLVSVAWAMTYCPPKIAPHILDRSMMPVDGYTTAVDI